MDPETTTIIVAECDHRRLASYCVSLRPAGKRVVFVPNVIDPQHRQIEHITVLDPQQPIGGIIFTHNLCPVAVFETLSPSGNIIKERRAHTTTGNGFGSTKFIIAWLTVKRLLGHLAVRTLHAQQTPVGVVGLVHEHTVHLPIRFVWIPAAGSARQLADGATQIVVSDLLRPIT